MSEKIYDAIKLDKLKEFLEWVQTLEQSDIRDELIERVGYQIKFIEEVKLSDIG